MNRMLALGGGAVAIAVLVGAAAAVGQASQQPRGPAGQTEQLPPIPLDQLQLPPEETEAVPPPQDGSSTGTDPADPGAVVRNWDSATGATAATGAAGAAARAAAGDEIEVDDLLAKLPPEQLERLLAEDRAAPRPYRLSLGNLAVVRVTDRVLGGDETLTLKAGETRTFGALQITHDGCWVSHPEDAPDSLVFLRIEDVGRPAQRQLVKLPDRTLRPGQAVPRRVVFSGYMSAASLSLNALDHPTYDVWAVRCGGDLRTLIRRPDGTVTSVAGGPQTSRPASDRPRQRRRSEDGQDAQAPATPSSEAGSESAPASPAPDQAAAGTPPG
jgi:hypothetical protein